jgi:hypothetical protein
MTRGYIAVIALGAGLLISSSVTAIAEPVVLSCNARIWPFSNGEMGEHRDFMMRVELETNGRVTSFRLTGGSIDTSWSTQVGADIVAAENSVDGLGNWTLVAERRASALELERYEFAISAMAREFAYQVTRTCLKIAKSARHG